MVRDSLLFLDARDDAASILGVRFDLDVGKRWRLVVRRLVCVEYAVAAVYSELRYDILFIKCIAVHREQWSREVLPNRTRCQRSGTRC